MGTPSSRTLNYDALLSSTLEAYRDGLTDNIIASNVLLSAIKAEGGWKTQNGGERIRIPLMYGKTPVATYSGYDTLDTTPTDGITTAFYTWRQMATPIAISRIEERQNSGDSALFNLLKAKIKQAELSIGEELNFQLLGKTVDSGRFTAGNGGKDFDPLTEFIPKDPTASVSVGNIAQNTFTWWRNRSVDGSTDGGTSTDSGADIGYDLNTWAELFDAINHLYNRCSRGPGGRPNMVISDQQGFETFESGMRDKTRYVQQGKGSLAFDNIMFKAGVPMYWDEFMPDLENGVIYTSSSFATSTYLMLNTRYLYFVVDSKTNFIKTPFTKPENQDAKVAHVLLYGNLACSQRRKQGILYGVSQSITS